MSDSDKKTEPKKYVHRCEDGTVIPCGGKSCFCLSCAFKHEIEEMAFRGDALPPSDKSLLVKARDKSTEMELETRYRDWLENTVPNSHGGVSSSKDPFDGWKPGGWNRKKE